MWVYERETVIYLKCFGDNARGKGKIIKLASSCVCGRKEVVNNLSSSIGETEEQSRCGHGKNAKRIYSIEDRQSQTNRRAESDHLISTMHTVHKQPGLTNQNTKISRSLSSHQAAWRMLARLANG